MKQPLKIPLAYPSLLYTAKSYDPLGEGVKRAVYGLKLLKLRVLWEKGVRKGGRKRERALSMGRAQILNVTIETTLI